MVNAIILKIKINHITAIRSLTILALTAAITLLLYKACEQRRETEPSLTETEALLRKGDDAMRNDSPDSALHYYRLVYSSFTPEMGIDSKKACAKALNNSGYIYYFRYNDYPKAYRCFLDACDIAEETGARRTLSRSYLNIGNIYGAYDITDQTVGMYRKAFLSAVADEDWEIVLTAFINMVGGYIQNPEEWPGDIMEIARTFDRCGVPDTVPNALFAKEKLQTVECVSANDHEGAIRHIRRGIGLLPPGGGNERIRLVEELIEAVVTERDGDRDGAEQKYLGILAEAERLSEADVRMVCMQALGGLSEANGDTVRAHRFTVAKYAIQDSLFNIRRFATITDIAREHEKGWMQREFNLLAGQKRLQTVILVILAFALAVIGLFLVWMWHKKRQLDQSNRELFNKYQELLELKSHSDRELTSESDSAGAGNGDADMAARSGSHQESHAEEASRQQGGCIDKKRLRRLYTDIVAVMNSDAIFDQSFSADTLATMTGSKTRYVSEAISKEYGNNFSTMLAEYRVREAGRLMADPGKPERLTLEAIAAEVGFKNRSTFSVTFKKITGLTPREYQRIARAETGIES